MANLRSSNFLSSNLLGVNNFVFTFRLVIHSELIFVRTIRSVCLDSFYFIFCMWMSNTICWKECLCSFVPLFCQRSVDWQKSVCIYMSLFLGSRFCSSNLFVYSFANTTSSWLHFHSELISLEVRQCHLPASIFSFNTMLAILGLLPFCLLHLIWTKRLRSAFCLSISTLEFVCQ